MAEPSPSRPVPGPPARPAPRAEAGARFAGLADRPVAEHVEVFEAEQDRLQAELGTIDRV